MQISQVIKKQSKKLKEYNIKNYNLEAEILLSFLLKKPREFLFTYPKAKLNFFLFLKYKHLINKRLSGVPLAYIIGSKEFYGLSFYVDKDVLIPRPETELIVEEALGVINNHLDNDLNLIDVGTGCGCIIISLIKNLKEKSSLFFQNKKIEGLSIDISGNALEIAKENAWMHGVYDNIKFLKSDLLKELVKDDKKFEGLTVITSNLPYLTPNQVKSSPSIQKEPKIALIAGSEGLLYYRKLFKEIKYNLNKFNGPLFIFCEIDESQTKNIKKLIKKEFPRGKIEIKKDLRGFDRLVIIKMFD